MCNVLFRRLQVVGPTCSFLALVIGAKPSTFALLKILTSCDDRYRHNIEEKKGGKGSGVNLSSTKQRLHTGSSHENQNRRNSHDQDNSSPPIDRGSSSSIWAILLHSSSKLSELEISRASLRPAANHPNIPVSDAAVAE